MITAAKPARTLTIIRATNWVAPLLCGVGLLVSVLQTGCTVGPNFLKPAVPGLNAEYISSEDDITYDEEQLTTWWTHFEDPVLDALIREACQQNLDLQEAYTRIVEARAQIGVSRSSLFPQIANDGSYSYRRTSPNASQFVSVDSLSEGFDFYSGGFDTTWEIDLFGKIRRSIEASIADYKAEWNEVCIVKITLLADIATNYTNLRVIDERLRIAHQNLQSQQQTLAIVMDRLQSGLVSELDKARAESNVFFTSATIPTLHQERQVALNRISVLLGNTPSLELSGLLGHAPIPKTPPTLAVGVPVDLVWRRPDVRQAECEVAAASARIGVAMADRYPQFTIRGDFAVDTRDLANWFTSQSIMHSVGPSFRWNILNFGRVLNNIEISNARYQGAVLRFRNTVLQAVEEVENGLRGFHTEVERSAELRKAVDATTTAARLSRTQYQSGLVDFQTVLDADRQRLTAQEQFVVSRGAAVLNVIKTYKALGGGWDADCCAELFTDTIDENDATLAQRTRHQR